MRLPVSDVAFSITANGKCIDSVYRNKKDKLNRNRIIKYV